jgi:hypothetical protein
MKISDRINDLHALLKSHGFARKGRVWNRAGSAYIDVVDVQVSKLGPRCTINLGVLDRDLYRACWDREPPNFSRDEHCTVKARLGILATGYDRWWPLDDETAWLDAVVSVAKEGLPFIARMHSDPAMEAFLLPSLGGLPRYPPEAISVAVLRSRQGDSAEGCRLLRHLLDSTTPAWRDRVAAVLEKNCRESV